MSALRVENLSISVSKKKVFFEDISFEVAAGELVTLIGPAGSGKSILLQTIAGLHPHTSGHVYLGDQDISDLKPNMRDIAMVFQNEALFEHWSVQDNIRMALHSEEISNLEADQRLALVISMLELDKLLDVPIAHLTAGNKQRVAVARAFMREASLFLFDDPFGKLPARLRSSMRQKLARFRRTLKSPMLMVTQERSEALAVADRVIVLQDGHIRAQGTTREIYIRPPNIFTANQTGELNMDFTDPRAFELNPSQFTLCIRPEHLRPCTEKEARLKGTVWNVECLGASTSVIVVSEMQKYLSFMVLGQPHFEQGQVVYLSFEDKNLLVYDVYGNLTSKP